ncbi:UTP--glucose-1-phosphate uridylyltransferase [Candidatus Endowatersipora endosymbiont of Watersipora subatra]|uniref:UTP--glucose-1-phosphate uridylyltransferase n=1 Tax=Candidatus Endowatersipora endosymbiont of Watersipora subatra TaxID=3077946 RepID=UPI00312CB4A9
MNIADNNLKRRIDKVVIPVAGLGTRFLPASKAVPKEMFTIVDMPIIQYAINEAREAGIENFVFVTGRNKAVIEDYFDLQPQLKKNLIKHKKENVLSILEENHLQAGRISFTPQRNPLGLGHAVWCARNIIGNEPFALLLPDMLMQAQEGCLFSMMKMYNKVGGNIIAAGECSQEDIRKYGIITRGNPIGDGFKIAKMREKPSVKETSSQFFINGRYILQPEIFRVLENQEMGINGEFQITDAILSLAQQQPLYGYQFEGKIFDCGSKEGFIAANIAFALSREDTRPFLQTIIKDLLKKDPLSL